MKTEMEKAKHTLFDPSELRVQNVSIFPGSNREVTPEQVANEINNVIQRLANGEYEEITDLDD